MWNYLKKKETFHLKSYERLHMDVFVSVEFTRKVSLNLENSIKNLLILFMTCVFFMHNQHVLTIFKIV